jgi:two-component system, OmpR family, alkaline phosphatase synthesis response regulator PhoP
MYTTLRWKKLEAINKNAIDLAILDIMLPGKDGFSLIPEFLAKEIPVIFLTARNSVSDKVHGLEIGAEDYIIKPFEAVELIARVNVVLRRGKKAIEEFQIDETIINFKERKIIVEGKEVDTTNKEFELLEILIQNKNIALSRDKILELIWGYDFLGETRTVDVHIQKLRKKLKWENHIKTIFRYGYRLEV